MQSKKRGNTETAALRLVRGLLKRRHSIRAQVLSQDSVLDFDYAESAKELLLKHFKTSTNGLSTEEARKRIKKYGHNEIVKKKKKHFLVEFLLEFRNPLVVVLLALATASFIAGDRVGAFLIYAMAWVSVSLSFAQVHKAGEETEKLTELVRPTAMVYRNGKPKEERLREIVPGDIVYLSAGDIVPADVRIISSKDLFVDQASLTGEPFPVEKFPEAVIRRNRSIFELTNIAFMGSSVVSGTALGMVIQTGLSTQFGELSKKLSLIRVNTAFDKGIANFTWFIIKAMLALVAIIFAINAVFKHDVLQALFFALAVAVGLTPEMLPAMIAINLSKGAIDMSRKKVVVKRLNSIQNLGAMDVLCTDKTGTLTLGEVVLERYYDVGGHESEEVLKLAYINSYYQTGLKSLMDEAILKHEKLSVKVFKKIDEIPFDFSRKLMSVVVYSAGQRILISKGAPEEIFERCKWFEINGRIKPIWDLSKRLKKEADKLRSEGFRVLAVAYRNLEAKPSYSVDDEQGLILKGYLAFLDPPKPTARQAIEALKQQGIQFKVLTGDSEIITESICRSIGLDIGKVVTGARLEKLKEKEFRDTVERYSVFAMLTPVQKEKIIYTLQKNKHVVGFLGDGINDAPALKTADVGISVNNAADIAKETADIVLLQKSLLVLKEGVLEGRKTFGNIIKYLKMGASSNLGNMISMTGASIFLPFLPMLPLQVLLNNFLYDLSQIAIPTDKVDPGYLAKPRQWNINYIKKFMMLFGSISSIFDFITFGILLFAFRAGPEFFRTGWFLESLVTQVLVIHVIRTGKIPFLQSMPGKYLALSSVLVAAAGLSLPFFGLAGAFSFIKLPAIFLLVLAALVSVYLITVQLAKSWFVKKYGYM